MIDQKLYEEVKASLALIDDDILIATENINKLCDHRAKLNENKRKTEDILESIAEYLGYESEADE